jgi:hypothetical protein
MLSRPQGLLADPTEYFGFASLRLGFDSDHVIARVTVGALKSFGAVFCHRSHYGNGTRNRPAPADGCIVRSDLLPLAALDGQSGRDDDNAAAPSSLQPNSSSTANVCLWHKADIAPAPLNVRFWG